MKSKIMKILQSNSSNRDKLERIIVVAGLDYQEVPKIIVNKEYWDEFIKTPSQIQVL